MRSGGVCPGYQVREKRYDRTSNTRVDAVDQWLGVAARGGKSEDVNLVITETEGLILGCSSLALVVPQWIE
jgi:hypothetical protein